MIQLNDYQSGFIGGETQGAEELLKAMQAGAITGRDTANQSLTQEPLKVESLEKTLKLLEFRQQDLKLINAMPKITAYNTVEEFVQLSSYGTNRGGFYAEGELSDVEDSKYIRRAEKIKYLQVTGEVTLQAQMVRSYVDAMKKEVENKVMWIQRRANEFITKGNENNVTEQWNGLYAQHASIGSGAEQLYTTIESYFTSEVIIDLRGASLKQQDVERAAVIVDKNYGIPTHLFATTSVISALAQDYYNDQRILLNGGFSGTLGIVPKVISTTMGDITLGTDKFMANNPSKLLTDAADSVKAPGLPVVDAVPALASDSSSKLQSGEAGAVLYAVSAFNRYGEGQLKLQNGTAITLTVGSSVDLDISAPVTGSYAATGYRVYRTAVGGVSTSPFYPLFDISVAELAAGYDGAAAGKIRDRHRFLPNMETAFLAEMTEDVMAFKQLAPVSKLDLAIVGPSRSFITFLFATPILFAPKKVVKFINVSKTVTA